VQDRRVTQRILVLEDVEVPLVEVVHYLYYVVPNARLHLDDLLDAFLLFLELVGIGFLVVAVDLLKEVVEVALEPLRRVIGCLCSDV
jgi:hypothetical protein